MALHLIKLCVGVESLEELTGWVADDIARQRGMGLDPQDTHTTRMMPKRIPEILDGGSLYWVIKGQVQARQRILDLEAVVGSDNIQRCRIVFEPEVVPTELQPKRPFQGWRYLLDKDAPRDLASLGGGGGDELPPALKAELAELGLL